MFATFWTQFYSWHMEADVTSYSKYLLFCILIVVYRIHSSTLEVRNSNLVTVTCLSEERSQ